MTVYNVNEVRDVIDNRKQPRTVTVSEDESVIVVSDNDTLDSSLADIIINDVDDTITLSITPFEIETEHDQDFDR